MRYPPAVVIDPPEGRADELGFCLTNSAIAPELLTPLFSDVGPKVPRKLLTKGIYFSLEVEVSGA
jgi:hypothetical protein